MKIKPEELTSKGYVLLDKLAHKELVPFIRTYMNKRTRFSIIYYLSNAIVFAITGYLFAAGYNAPDYGLGNRFSHFSYGLALAFMLLPLHEYIHVLAYKSQGATNTSYAANLKKMYFMALADKFVANKKEFQVVALAPFIVITTVLTIAIFFVNQSWSLTLAATLLAHTAMCSGDFGLLSYFEYHKDKNVVTYDDIASQTSFFYGLAKQTEKTTV